MSFNFNLTMIFLILILNFSLYDNLKVSYTCLIFYNISSLNALFIILLLFVYLYIMIINKKIIY